MNKTKVTVQQFENYLWGSANFLRNKIDAGDYKAYIFPLMFYKRICDLYDDEYQRALEESDNDIEYAESEVNHQFQIPKGCHWKDVRNIAKDVGQKIQKSMRQIEKANPDTLFGVFGDANWGNKERLSDETLGDLVEHFSTLNLSTTTIPDDLMGTGYEFLIKKFADDSGHTAAEFYTNRTVVTLMTKLVNPQTDESVYDPTCGTGGMLLECVNYLKRNKKDFRTLKIFGQEKNVITSGIARMNMLLHRFEDAHIKQGDTLSSPLFLSGDKLQKFDVILANPPYSIKRWNRNAWRKDPFNRNIYGTPPQARADFAFIQHIISSLSEKGRTAILLPHGVLFRDGEADIREKLIHDDKLEAVIGLGPDLFYNATMESCILVLRNKKNKEKKNKVIFINAVDQVNRSENKNYLSENNIKTISDYYISFKTIPGITYVSDNAEIKENQFLLNIPTYIKKIKSEKSPSLEQTITDWKRSLDNVISSSQNIFKDLPVIINE